MVTIEMTIRMMWFDTRAKMKEPKEMFNNQSEMMDRKLKPKPEYVTINPRLGKYFWIPDVFIDQAKQVREPTFHVLPASLRIYRQIDQIFLLQFK